MARIPTDIITAIGEHGMDTTRDAGGKIVFTSRTTGKVVWQVNDANAARRFVESCRINPSTIEHIVTGRL